MRLLAIVTFCFLVIAGYSQSTVSTLLDEKFIQRFSVDSGTYLPVIPLVDTKGKKVTLTDFKGKVLYIGVWATSCGSSVLKFPYQEQLFKRLNDIHIDTSIQLINIHIEDSKRQWLKTIRKYHPDGVNLFCKDTSLLTKWNISAPPTYILLDQFGKIIAKDISQPDEAGTIDYILYSLTKNANITEALWTMYKQQNLMKQYKTSSAISDDYFKTWFNLTIQSLVDFNNWRIEHEKKKSH